MHHHYPTGNRLLQVLHLEVMQRMPLQRRNIVSLTFCMCIGLYKSVQNPSFPFFNTLASERFSLSQVAYRYYTHLEVMQRMQLQCRNIVSLTLCLSFFSFLTLLCLKLNSSTAIINERIHLEKKCKECHCSFTI